VTYRSGSVSDTTWRTKPRWWWVFWLHLAIFIALWVPSLSDDALDWMWKGYFGVTTIAMGIVSVFAPERVIASRARFQREIPPEQRRGDAIDAWLDRRSAKAVRATGIVLVLFGVVILAEATFR
jgi:hypothetical protein